jgi:hypothetical protein
MISAFIGAKIVHGQTMNNSHLKDTMAWTWGEIIISFPIIYFVNGGNEYFKDATILEAPCTKCQVTSPFTL